MSPASYGMIKAEHAASLLGMMTTVYGMELAFDQPAALRSSWAIYLAAIIPGDGSMTRNGIQENPDRHRIIRSLCCVLNPTLKCSAICPFLKKKALITAIFPIWHADPSQRADALTRSVNNTGSAR